MSADPLLLPALRMRASMYLSREQPQQALDLLLRYVRLDPVNNQSRKLLSDTYRLLGETAKAEEQMKLRDRLYDFNQQLLKLNTQLMQNPQNDEVRFQIGALWLGINQLLDARLWFISALEINPNNIRARQALERLDPTAAAQIPR